MGELTHYISEGIHTVLAVKGGAVHLIFVLILCSSYKAIEWRRILFLITLFTISYSLAFFLSGMKLLQINAQLIKALLPVTILVIASFNLLGTNKNADSTLLNFSLSAVFGFIHGIEYYTDYTHNVNSFQSKTEPLLAFNSGLFLGELLIIAFYVFLFMIFTYLVKRSFRAWHLFINGVGLTVAMLLIFS